MTSTIEYFQPPLGDGKFKAYKPHTRGNAARITDDQWEPHLPLIRSLHNARQTRTQILQVLREHGLYPSVAQLYAKMSRWGLKGYGPMSLKEKEDTAAVCEIIHANEASRDQQLQPADMVEDSSEDSQATCVNANDADSSDTMYETDVHPPDPASSCADAMICYASEPCFVDSHISGSQHLRALSKVDAASDTESRGSDSISQIEPVQRLPSDIMTFVHSINDLNEFDRHDVLNEVASFLCATASFSDAFILFDSAYSYLKDNYESPMALVFATTNCLRSATFREQCQYAGALMGEALASHRLLSYSNPLAQTALTALNHIGRELCVKSGLEHLNILYSQMQFQEATFSANNSPESNTNEILLHCSDPFLLAKTTNRPEVLIQSLDVSGIALGRVVGKLSRWCSLAIDDFNPISMLPSAGFNPSDPESIARFSTALSCHFVRKWSFLSLTEVLGHCNELLPPDRKDAAARLCKLAIHVLSTLATYTIYQAAGMTMRSASNEFPSPENQAQYISPLASHLDALSRMRNRDRVMIFAEMHHTTYARTLVYRQQMDGHCLTAHVRETGFLLAASLIRHKRALNVEVPQPAPELLSRIPTPTRETANRSPSCASDSSSSMRNLARRNLLLPGIMSKNGSHIRKSWVRRLSTDSHESWNFTKVTGLPAGPTPPESSHDQMQCDSIVNLNNDFENPNNCEMTGVDIMY